MCHLAQPEKVDETGDPLVQFLLLAGDERQAQGVLQKAATRPAMAADQDVLQHRHGAEKPKILESAPDAEGGDAVARRIDQRAALEFDQAAIELVQPA
jgi:hypothetical protein